MRRDTSLITGGTRRSTAVLKGDLQKEKKNTPRDIFCLRGRYQLRRNLSRSDRRKKKSRLEIEGALIINDRVICWGGVRSEKRKN